MMGVESTILPMDHAVLDNSDTENSEVVECDSPVVGDVEKSVAEEVCLQVPLAKKEDIDSLGTVCDVENNKGDVAEAITLNGVTLQLSISCKEPEESLSLDCQTPRGNIFDPFAPGPEEAGCGAPKKKLVRGSEALSRRKLNFEADDIPIRKLNFEADDIPIRRLSYEFDDSEEEEVYPPIRRLSYEFDDSEEEEVYLQGICKMFLDLIFSSQALDATQDREDLIDAIPPESYRTPESQPLLTGIADTCPDAPLRPSLKMLKLSPGICRKLDFGSVSPKSLFAEDNN
uniref:Uncharacterized protein n=1 Tax=Avena sativa TaxID=4498 RepID=A0ACD5YK38_AVESA